jgi:phospholipid/cholesterol/gamma-HCH transport system permease protein
MKQLLSLNKSYFKFFEIIGEFVRLLIKVISSVLISPPSWRLIREQFFHFGVMSLAVVAITGFTTGFVLAAQSFFQLGDTGMDSITGVLVAKSMITELGPVLTAFMITGRVGASMCAELATMKVTEQIDALRSMSINPYAYLVAPRFIAGVVMNPLLSLFSMLMGIFGGYLIAVYHFNLPPTSYFRPIQIQISEFDLFTGLIKSFVFGIIFVSVCCYKGIHAKGGAAGVGKSTTQSVVTSYVAILITDFFLTIFINLIYTKIHRL